MKYENVDWLVLINLIACALQTSRLQPLNNQLDGHRHPLHPPHRTENQKENEESSYGVDKNTLNTHRHASMWEYIKIHSEIGLTFTEWKAKKMRVRRGRIWRKKFLSLKSRLLKQRDAF